MARKTDKPTLKHRAEALTLLAAGWLLTWLPLGVAVRLARAMGTVASLTGIRARTVRENIDHAFGDTLAPAERKRLFREAYRSLCTLAVESFFLERRPTPWIRRMVTPVGLENLAAAKADPRGFIFVSGHIGNWELVGAWIEEAHPCTSLAKSLHNPIVQDRVQRTRLQHGLEIIWADQPDALRRIAATLRANDRRLNILSDQDAGVEGVFAPFFGRPASTTPTPALLSIRHGMPLMPTYAIRNGPTSHSVHFLPLIDPADLPPGTRDEQVAELTARHVAVLEELVRRYPEQYFWFHRRWKTTPEYARQKLEKRRRKKMGKIQALRSITDNSPPEQGRT